MTAIIKWNVNNPTSIHIYLYLLNHVKANTKRTTSVVRITSPDMTAITIIAQLGKLDSEEVSTKSEIESSY